MNYFIKESSERSDEKNHFKQFFNVDGFQLYEFEGYTIKDGAVSLLLDKYKIIKENSPPKKINFFLNDFKNYLGEETLQNKFQFSKRIKVDWYVTFYAEEDKENKFFSYIIINLTKIIENRFIPLKSHLILNKKNTTLAAFDQFLSDYRSYSMKAGYIQQDLPLFDRVLRENYNPWPGNLDGLLFYQGNPVYLIEFQKTKYAVEDHDNNAYIFVGDEKFQQKGNSFLINEKGRRVLKKSDSYRWLVLKNFSDTTNINILTVVWNENSEKVVLKKIQMIDLTKNLYANEKKIVWGEFLVATIENKKEIHDFLLQP